MIPRNASRADRRLLVALFAEQFERDVDDCLARLLLLALAQARTDLGRLASFHVLKHTKKSAPKEILHSVLT
jgi:hypothetical protein